MYDFYNLVPQDADGECRHVIGIGDERAEEDAFKNGKLEQPVTCVAPLCCRKPTQRCMLYENTFCLRL